MYQRKYLVLLAMAGMLVSFDQLAKFVVMGRFQLGQSQVILENFFNLTRVHNTGAAFGLLAGLADVIREPFFIIIPSVTLLVILFVFYRINGEQWITIYGLSMIVGGALGNIVDRVRLGYVVDFLDFHWYGKAHFPAFNIADIAISTGVALLLISIQFEKETKAQVAA